MAYGVMSFNGDLGNVEMLPGIVNKFERASSGSTQMDMIFFTDFISSANPAASINVSGGVFYCPLANGAGISMNNTADMASVGVNACIGVARLTTGTTNNATGYASITTANAILSGIPTPNSGYITKYEWECLLETDSTVFGALRNGSIRFGMMSTSINTAPSDGVYFEFLYDGTTNDTVWNVVFRKDGSQERVSTGISFLGNKLYRMYMSVEKDTSGNYTTTYKLKNITDNTESNSTAAPSNAAVYYPAATGDYMGVSFVCSKAGTATTNSTFVILDYMGVRIRRELTREMVMLSS